MTSYVYLGLAKLTKGLAACALLIGCSASGEESEQAAGATRAASQTPAKPQSGTARPMSPTALPPEVGRWIAGLRAECREAGGRVTGEQIAPLVADFNGDGRQDYVLSAAETIDCSAGASFFLAGQVPSWNFFVSTPRGYVGGDEGVNSLGVELATHEGRPVVLVNSGGPGAFERPWETAAYGWNGRAMAPLAYFNAEGRRVSADGTAPGGGWVQAAFPESLPPGFYTESCWPPDPDGMAYLYLNNRVWGEWDYEHPINRIERNGPTRFRFHSVVEDEEGNRSPHVIDIQTGRFGDFVELVEGERGRAFTHCQEREVPAQVRRDRTVR